MPINEVLTGNQISVTSNPSEVSTDIVVEPGGVGDVWLEQQVAGGKWMRVTKRQGAYVLSTPDLDILYRFSSSLGEGSTRVFLGP